MTMDRQEAKRLRVELNKVLEQFDSSYSITIGNCSYNSTDATFKVTLAPEGALSKEERDLEYFADMYKVDPNKIGEMRDGQYSMVGFNSKARKNIFIIQKLSTGSKYVIDEYVARKYFGIEEKIEA
jgi:hypothetical protein